MTEKAVSDTIPENERVDYEEGISEPLGSEMSGAETTCMPLQRGQSCEVNGEFPLDQEPQLRHPTHALASLSLDPANVPCGTVLHVWTLVYLVT